MSPQQFHITDETRLRNCLEYISNLPLKSGYVVTITKESRPRTSLQNDTMHKYFDLLAAELNSAGQDKVKVFAQMRQGVSLPWSRDSIKEDLWRPVMEAATDKTSTTKLDTKEVSHVYEILNRFTAERLGVSVPFPERDK